MNTKVYILLHQFAAGKMGFHMICGYLLLLAMQQTEAEQHLQKAFNPHQGTS
jgi:hypothetical protein